MNDEVDIIHKAEIQKAVKEIVQLSRGLREGSVVASVTPTGKIDVYRSLGDEVQGYNDDCFSEAQERVVFWGDADIDYPQEFSVKIVKQEICEALKEKGYTIQ